MKRLFTIISLLLSLTLCFGAQPAKKTSKKTKSKTPTKSSVKIDPHKENWTVGLKGGINYFRLSPAQTSPIEVNGEHYGLASDISQQFVVFSEYNFNRYVGIGMYFGNYCYNRYIVLGSSIEFGVYAHINLMECLTWNNPPLIARRLHIFLDAGLGVGAVWQNNQITSDPSSDIVMWNAASVLKTALQFEFMIKPQWGILLEGEYHGYGRKRQDRDGVVYSLPWINAGMISAGVRYYFDDRKKEKDPKLDENELPIRKPRNKVPKNTYNVNVKLASNDGTQQMDTTIAMQITMPNLSVSPKMQSKEIKGALQVLEKQGTGTVLINSVNLVNNQLTDESMKVLDEIANTLIANNSKWNKIELLYVTHDHASERAAIIATYLRAKGIKHIVAKGREGEDNSDKSDLIINIK